MQQAGIWLYMQDGKFEPCKIFAERKAYFNELNLR